MNSKLIPKTLIQETITNQIRPPNANQPFKELKIPILKLARVPFQPTANEWFNRH